MSHPKVAPRIRELEPIARRRAEAGYGVTVDKLTDMFMDTYESDETRPAGKLRTIESLARLHGLI